MKKYYLLLFTCVNILGMNKDTLREERLSLLNKLIRLGRSLDSCVFWIHSKELSQENFKNRYGRRSDTYHEEQNGYYQRYDQEEKEFLEIQKRLFGLIACKPSYSLKSRYRSEPKGSSISSCKAKDGGETGCSFCIRRIQEFFENTDEFPFEYRYKS